MKGIYVAFQCLYLNSFDIAMQNPIFYTYNTYKPMGRKLITLWAIKQRLNYQIPLLTSQRWIQ